MDVQTLRGNDGLPMGKSVACVSPFARHSLPRMTTRRAELYHLLAEALAPDGPPDWMCLPGREWPLTRVAARMASDPATRPALRKRIKGPMQALSAIEAEDAAGRLRRHRALFAGSSRPRLWLYESAFLNGRLIGPQTFAVERAYRAAGLAPEGAELPDHASLELEFLACLAEADSDAARSEERRFVHAHAGRWLPSLGQQLAEAGEDVYAPIGRLLANFLDAVPAGRAVTDGAEASAPSVSRHVLRAPRLPVMPDPEGCTLCGFCAQACHARALGVRESDERTSLVLLNPAACTGCGKCAVVCPTGALRPAEERELCLDGALPGRVLRASPRMTCPACGAPTVSRAEADFLVSRLGHPAWLDYCIDCRARSTVIRP